MLNEKLEAKVVLTGASGFVGGRLRDALLDAGADVVAIRRATSPEPKRGRSVVADYADRASLERLIADEQPDYLFHVAGATKGVTYDDFKRANVMPTRHLIEAVAAKHPSIKRFLFVSSLTAYGPSAPGRPLTEGDPRRPIEHYGTSKLEAERVVEGIGDAVPWSIVRPCGVYGPGDGDYFNLFKEVEAGRNAFFGNKDRWFSAVYVDDCVRAIVACARSEATVGKGYFICDGKPITWGDFQQTIVEASGRRKVRTINLPGFLVHVAAMGGELATKVDGKPRLFNKQKAKMGEQDAWTCVHDAARDDFGYVPQVGVQEGVRLAYEWYRSNGWL